MKYNPLYKWQYLSQIKLDLYRTFKATLWGCPKIIQHSKVDQIILNSSQETSTSSKYDHILEALLIMLGSWKSAYNSRMTYNALKTLTLEISSLTTDKKNTFIALKGVVQLSLYRGTVSRRGQTQPLKGGDPQPPTPPTCLPNRITNL